MTIPDRASGGWSWGQLLGGLGVVLSLLFVATEIRQNTEAVRGATFQQVSDARREMMLELLHDPELAAALTVWEHGSDQEWASLPAEQRAKVPTWVSAYLTFLDNAYYQVQLGILPESAFEGWLLSSRHDRFKRYWAPVQDRFTAEFREYLETH